MTPKLFIGNYNYSSWSMRPWLTLAWAGLRVDTEVITLGPRDGAPNPAILAVNPSGTVPALALEGGVLVWDSLSICLWAAEQCPPGTVLPTDPVKRAITLSCVAEMHAGFQALRRYLPMNIRRRAEPRTWDEGTARDIQRMLSLWTLMRTTNGIDGGWLHGARPGLADAYFAPVATRFRTYAVAVDEMAAGYMANLFLDPNMRLWEARAEVEAATMPDYDDI
jgi:glutathione S-transferase